MAGAAFANPDRPQNAGLDNLYQNFVSKLAANLGVDQDKITAAIDATKKQMLNEAVQQGKLTQEQADKIASSKGFGFGMFGFRHNKEHHFRGPKLDNAANVLGMTVDQLKTELQSGKKMKQIITEHGMTMDQFRQKMLELRKEAISKAVADGKLTQDQANKIIQRMEQHFNNPQAGESK